MPDERIRVIPHGAFEHLALTPRAPLPAELGRPAAPLAAGAHAAGLHAAGADEAPAKPVVLSFGLIRPYKGTDVLLRAWRQVQADAELWIVGRPRGVDMDELRALADHRVRFVSRFVSDGELAACFDAAQVAVLPYREIEQSGVLASAFAFGTPTVATAVGAFPEAEALGALTTVPPGDEPALAAALDRLLADPTERAILTAGARRLALGAWSWSTVAEQHLAAYRDLLGDLADAKIVGLR
ncbi:MAG: glycosyltransferase [Patulibacter minatonensis]